MGCCERNCSKSNEEEDMEHDDYTCKVTTEYFHSLSFQSRHRYPQSTKGNNREFYDLYDNIEIKDTFEDDNESESSFSATSSVANTYINIIYEGEKYEFYIKEKYDLCKVLYRFKKNHRYLKPKGIFIYKNRIINDLSKTCGELGISEGDEITLK